MVDRDRRCLPEFVASTPSNPEPRATASQQPDRRQPVPEPPPARAMSVRDRVALSLLLKPDPRR
jgi:hypothetical protein